MLAASLRRCSCARGLHSRFKQRICVALCSQSTVGVSSRGKQSFVARKSEVARRGPTKHLLCVAAGTVPRRQLVFLGSPEVAAHVLRHLCNHSQSDLDCTFEVAAVVTQPWAARGRSRKPKPSCVEEAAVHCGIPEERILRPASAKDAGFLEELSDMRPDLCVTAAYGNILPQAFLDIPKFGTINIHPSLLPKFRGAAPVQRALEEGVEESGVSVAFTVRAMDAGPILAQKAVDMSRYQDADEALKDLFDIGIRILIDQLPRVWSGAAAAEAVPQDDSQATSAPKLRKEDAELDFRKTASVLANQVRAFSSWPGSKATFCIREGAGGTGPPMILKIIQAAACPEPGAEGLRQEAGHILRTPRKELLVRCGEGTVLQLEVVQPAGKKPMAVSAYLNGLPAGAELLWKLQ